MFTANIVKGTALYKSFVGLDKDDTIRKALNYQQLHGYRGDGYKILIGVLDEEVTAPPVPEYGLVPYSGPSKPKLADAAS